MNTEGVGRHIVYWIVAENSSKKRLYQLLHSNVHLSHEYGSSTNASFAPDPAEKEI
jgi:hypothetical protein